MKLYVQFKQQFHILPLSPDLNVIKKLCAQLDKSVHDFNVTSKEDERQKFQFKLVKSTPEKCKLRSTQKNIQRIMNFLFWYGNY